MNPSIQAQLEAALAKRERQLEGSSRVGRAAVQRAQVSAEAAVLRVALGWQLGLEVRDRYDPVSEKTNPERSGWRAGDKRIRERDALPPEVWAAIREALQAGGVNACPEKVLIEGALAEPEPRMKIAWQPGSREHLETEGTAEGVSPEVLAIVRAVVVAAEAVVRPELAIGERVGGPDGQGRVGLPTVEVAADVVSKLPVWGEVRHGRRSPTSAVVGHSETRTRGGVRISGGWLRGFPRGVVIRPSIDSPLGWAVAAWLAVRPRSPSEGQPVRGEAETLPCSYRRLPSAEAVEGDEPWIGAAWGSYPAKELGRLHTAVTLSRETEETRAALARWEAEAERQRELEALRLPGEVAALDAVAELKLGGSAETTLGLQPDLKGGEDYERAARMVRLAADLRGAPPDGLLVCGVRDRARTELRRVDRRKPLARENLKAWALAIDAEATAVEERRAGALEVDLWGSWCDRGEDGKVRGPEDERGGRAAAWWLVRAGAEAVSRRGAWERWSALRLALLAREQHAARTPPETRAGELALAGLRRDLELGALLRSAGDTCPDGGVIGDLLGTGAAVREALVAELRWRALEELRVEVDRAAGLRAWVGTSETDARRRALGPEEARALGRGETIAVARRPPRTLAGTAAAFVLAGYDGLALTEHQPSATGEPWGVVALVFSRREDHEGGVQIGEELLREALRECDRGWKTGAQEPPPAGRCAAEGLARTRTGAKGRGGADGGWKAELLPGTAFLLGRSIPFEWRGPAGADTSGGEVVVRWRGRWEVAPEARLPAWRGRGAEVLDLEVEARVRRERGEDGEQEGVDLRAWGDLTSLDCEPEADPAWSRLLVVDLEGILGWLRKANTDSSLSNLVERHHVHPS